MDNQKKPSGIQIEISPEMMGGVYSNLVILAHSRSEFIADFARLLPGSPKAPVVSRIILAPEHAKRLLLALQDNVGRYEREFGPISLGEPKPSGGNTANPFGVPEGKA